MTTLSMCKIFCRTVWNALSDNVQGLLCAHLPGFNQEPGFISNSFGHVKFSNVCPK